MATSVAAAVASVPSAISETLGGAAGVQATLNQRPTYDSTGALVSKSAVVETFTVTLPLHSMSPDFLIPDDK